MHLQAVLVATQNDWMNGIYLSIYIVCLCGTEGHLAWLELTLENILEITITRFA